MEILFMEIYAARENTNDAEIPVSKVMFIGKDPRIEKWNIPEPVRGELLRRGVT